MQGKKPSKLPSLLRKGVLTKEKFNLDQKWEKYSTPWPIILPTLLLLKEEFPIQVTSRYSNKIVNHLLSNVLIGSGCFIE